MSTFAPSAPLAPFVRRFNFVETDDEMTRVLLPETAVVMGFRYGGRASLVHGGAVEGVPDATLAGMRATVRRMRTSAGGGVVLAVFHEHGASPFVGVPLHELFGATIALDSVLPAGEVARAADQVATARGPAGRVAAFEAFLLARLRGALDPLVGRAADLIRAAPAAVRIARLADTLGLSQDRLEKRFRRVVGTTPKTLASILRLRRAVDAYRAGANLTRVAADAGYFDQSHFNRAFRAATGLPPREFFATGEHC